MQLITNKCDTCLATITPNDNLIAECDEGDFTLWLLQAKMFQLTMKNATKNTGNSVPATASTSTHNLHKEHPHISQQLVFLEALSFDILSLYLLDLSIKSPQNAKLLLKDTQTTEITK